MFYFVVNKHSRSGKGACIWEDVEAYLKEQKIEYCMYETKYRGHATELAKKICSIAQEFPEESSNEICLAALGGDGTINEVINGITRFDKVRFGVIPTGSGNDFARGLGIKGSPVEILKRMIACKEDFVIDLGQVTWDNCEKPRKFGISAGVGMDAIVCEKVEVSKLKKMLNKIHLGKLTYVLITIYTLFSMKTATCFTAVQNSSGQIKKQLNKMIFIAAMNFRAEGGGVPMSPKADAQDQALSICHVNGIPKPLTFCILPFLVAGKHTWVKGVQIVDCQKETIHLDVPMTLHTDGEVIDHVTDVMFECLPGVLRMML